MIVRMLTKRWVQIILLLMLLSATVAVRDWDPPIVEQLRDMVFDHYNRKMPRKAANQTVIIDIDEESLKRIGQWPWPRNVIGDLPLALKEMGVKATAFDIVFAEPDRTSPAAIAKGLPDTPELAPVKTVLEALPDNDSAFAAKVQEAGNVIMGFNVSDQYMQREPVLKASFGSSGQGANPYKFAKKFPNYVTPLPVLSDAAAGSGIFATHVSNDGLLRKVPLLVGVAKPNKSTGDVYPSLALEAVRIALGEISFDVTSYGRRSLKGYGIKSVKVGNYKIPTDETGRLTIYYTGHRSELFVPAWKVLARDVDPQLLKDKIAFVGTSAVGLLDLRSTPLNPIVPGVEIHAEMTEQILNGQFLQRPDFMEGGEKIFIAVIGLFIIFLSPFIGTGTLALLGAVMAVGGYFGGLYMYETKGYQLDPVYPTLAITLIFIVSSVLTNLRSEMEKRMIRQAFDRYLAPDLIEELVKHPEKLQLGGEVRELTVMFTDIRNFTTISENMDPAELIRMMNDFLTPMTSAVLDNKGFVDKYMGDAMMTFWNAPIDMPQHAENACKAALEMVRALAPVNAELKARAEAAGKPYFELKAGIGINSGRASVGNMGSKQRFAYSALGDTVNLASRMEGQTKAYGVSIMISSATHKAAPGFAAIELDLLTVKGRTEPERVYTLLGGQEEAKGEAFRSYAACHEKMLAAYRTMKWDEAQGHIDECLKLRPDMEGLYKLYRDRMAAYRQNPPPAGWNGTWVAKDK